MELLHTKIAIAGVDHRPVTPRAKGKPSTAFEVLGKIGILGVIDVTS